MNPLTSRVASVERSQDLEDQVLAEGGPLLAAITFLEGTAAGWRGPEIVDWITEQLVLPGRMLPPARIRQPPLNAFSLESAAHGSAGFGDLEKLVAVARARVIKVLRTFISPPPDDGFLKSAIFAGRVERRRVEGKAVWVALPHESDALSDIVLSLFAADILAHREFYEAKLCVCGVCGRISFEPDLTTRAGCPYHRPHRDTTSGFVLASKAKSAPNE